MSCTGCHADVDVSTVVRGLKGRGTVWLTDRRVRCESDRQLVFLNKDPGSGLDTLQVPLHRLWKGRYEIPLWSAPAWHAQVVYAWEGTHHVGSLTVRFLQGGGVAFQQACAQAQRQWDVDRQQETWLRMCKHFDSSSLPAARGYRGRSATALRHNQ